MRRHGAKRVGILIPPHHSTRSADADKSHRRRRGRTDSPTACDWTTPTAVWGRHVENNRCTLQLSHRCSVCTRLPNYSLCHLVVALSTRHSRASAPGRPESPTESICFGQCPKHIEFSCRRRALFVVPHHIRLSSLFNVSCSRKDFGRGTSVGTVAPIM